MKEFAFCVGDNALMATLTENWAIGIPKIIKKAKLSPVVVAGSLKAVELSSTRCHINHQKKLLKESGTHAVWNL